MKIFQVKYNQNRYCYYKSEKRELFNDNTYIYKDYNDCLNDKDRITGFEYEHIKKSLIKYFKEKI